MKVPFLDLKSQYVSIKEEIADALQQVLDNTAFAGGKFVEEFENEFAAFCNCDHAIGVGNGTDALWVALLAKDIKHGDEVITVPNTFIATAEAISICGATPVFIDVKEDTYNMDPDKIEAAITPKTKAIIPVHLYGQMADMDPIMEIAKAHNLFVIEDASQAHAAQYKGKKAGSIGDLGCFSFYPGKNLGAYGEAGAVVTNDANLAARMKMFRDHGQIKKYYHSIVGWNARMDGFQGAVLSVKLKHLEAWTEARRKNARLYDKLLGNTADIVIPKEADYARHVYHVYSIRTKNSDQMLQQLHDKDIYCAMHYPVPLHLQDAYKDLGKGKGSFPVAEICAEQQLSLPMYPELTEEMITHTASEIKKLL
ncbi:MAG: DegT/DnrJ/EryC1/StrS family aminotransferase [Candidatus Latescibacteria bacterium]|nr:DegT/DnrJ/EryC1/StrS family aminotransferase [Candidatus Latescibacterota bacterium]